MTIGERIKAEREQRGWSKVELAKRSGVSDRTIGYYEHGQREPQFEAIGKIMKAMGFQMQFVKEGVENE